MSAPLIWIGLPGLAAFLLYAIRRWERTIYVIEFILCLALVLLAWQLPVNEPISLGIPNTPSLRITDTLQIYGRRLVIGDEARPLIMLIYLSLSLWSGGAYIARVQRLFVPLSLGIAAMLTAALVIEPVLYAPLLMMAAALLCTPILAPPGQPARSGALRFLSFQLIGMCFILLAEWMLGLLQSNPNETSPIAPATLFFGLGFALTSGIVPFHTWIPMLTEEAHPFSASFVFFVLPAGMALLGLKYLGQFASLEIYPTIQNIMLYGGVLMVLVGGIWAGFQSHLGRILGFAVMVQFGLGLLAISLGVQSIQISPLRSLFFAQLIPQGVALAIWALALSSLRQALIEQGGAAALRFRNVQGLARRMPIAALSLILANFSLAGLPLLASFPGQIALWSALSQRSLPIALLSLAGCASLFAAGLRSMAVLVMYARGDASGDASGSAGAQSPDPAPDWRVTERPAAAALLIVGVLLLFFIGLSPQWLLPLIARLPAFTIQTP